MSDYYDLGSFGRPVSTTSPEAQRWFDRGLVWCYGFNHEEALRCFRRAVEADPGCGMAHWGVAYAIGPNYNRDWVAFEDDELADAVGTAHAALRTARALAADATPVERALIEALGRRFPDAAPPANCAVWSDAYADAMRDVHAHFPDDPDVAALFAEALIDRTPWALWDLSTGEPAEGADTAEAVAVLEAAMAASAVPHPGLLHLYLHAMEMSPHPERALPAADRLRGLVPDAGHLEHMPSHIDVLCGQYRDVVTANERAIAADRRFLAREGALNFYTLYRCHNYHFKIYGAMFLGQLEPALEAAGDMVASLPDELLRVTQPPMADWVEAFVPMRVHVLVRFGRWRALLDEPFPADPDLYCTTTAMLHYAKGIAHGALGDVEAAQAHREAFAGAVARVPESRYLFNNTCRDILAVAGAMLAGEVEYRVGDHDAAFAHLRRAVELDDALPYDEPWGWMQPTRHALGALLLEQGHAEEAEAVYRADLGLDGTLARPCQHPDNVWSLHGFHECLERLGKTSEAAIVKPRLELALARATVPVRASCFCRMTRAAA
ncbi:MAG: tetratricopeptide repeat protein [Solirubrobacteraceae bacterium]